jgi:protein-tyrosine phosphatase
VAEARTGVLFVCSGNICRSPTAEGVFRAKAKARGVLELLHVDSAGTQDYHVGEAPDPRAISHAARRGYDISRIRARQVSGTDFDRFEWILAMDEGHLRILGSVAPRGSAARLRKFLDYAPGWRGQDVPDPYYGGAGGFEKVLDMVEEGTDGLLEAVLAAMARGKGAGNVR